MCFEILKDYCVYDNHDADGCGCQFVVDNVTRFPRWQPIQQLRSDYSLGLECLEQQDEMVLQPVWVGKSNYRKWTAAKSANICQNLFNPFQYNFHYRRKNAAVPQKTMSQANNSNSFSTVGHGGSAATPPTTT